MARQNHAASEPRLGIYLAKARFLSQVLDYQVAGHGNLWRFWLRGTAADERRKCDEGLDGTFHLCHIFRREAPAPAMLHALKLWLTRLWALMRDIPAVATDDQSTALSYALPS